MDAKLMAKLDQIEKLVGELKAGMGAGSEEAPEMPEMEVEESEDEVESEGGSASDSKKSMLAAMLKKKYAGA